MLFAHLKRHLGFERPRLRGLWRKGRASAGHHRSELHGHAAAETALPHDPMPTEAHTD